MRAIVVDDHDGFRRLARELLSDEGFEVVGEARNGGEAIDAVAEFRPDLVLLDVQLPDILGPVVASVLGTAPEAPAVILVSNWEEKDLGQLTPSPCVRGFISKPHLTGKAIRAALDR